MPQRLGVHGIETDRRQAESVAENFERVGVQRGLQNNDQLLTREPPLDEPTVGLCAEVEKKRGEVVVGRDDDIAKIEPTEGVRLRVEPRALPDAAGLLLAERER